MSYDEGTGVFLWITSRGRIRSGMFAGTKSHGRNRPYWMIKIDGRFYYSHKLAWLLVYDEWPDQLDHINGNSLDNRIVNLRKCNMSQNKANSRKYKNNKSGAKGVHQRKDGRYHVSIQCNGKRQYVGSYETLGEAAAAYYEVSGKIFGDFARPG